MARLVGVGRILGSTLTVVGLPLGLLGCTQLFGPSEVGPIAILEAIPTSGTIGEDGKFYVDFYISAQARGRRPSDKIEIYFLLFGDNQQYVAEQSPMAVVSIDRHKVTHGYALPEGVSEKTYYATLVVYDAARNTGRDRVEITVWRPYTGEQGG